MNTPNLGLSLLDASLWQSTYFKDYLAAMSGNDDDSNMMKLDSAIAALQGILAGIGGEDESATVAAYVQAALDTLSNGVYRAARNETTYADIVTAHNSGYEVLCIENTVIYRLCNLDTTTKTALFVSVFNVDGNSVAHLMALSVTENNDGITTWSDNIKVTAEAIVDSVVEQNTSSQQKFWRGTKEEFDAIATKEDDVMYIVTDEDCNDPASTDLSLGLTGAAAGESPVVSAVDEDGKPTAWEPAELAKADGSNVSPLDANTWQENTLTLPGIVIYAKADENGTINIYTDAACTQTATVLLAQRLIETGNAILIYNNKIYQCMEIDVSSDTRMIANFFRARHWLDEDGHQKLDTTIAALDIMGGLSGERDFITFTEYSSFTDDPVKIYAKRDENGQELIYVDEACTVEADAEFVIRLLNADEAILNDKDLNMTFYLMDRDVENLTCDFACTKGYLSDFDYSIEQLDIYVYHVDILSHLSGVAGSSAHFYAFTPKPLSTDVFVFYAKADDNGNIFAYTDESCTEEAGDNIVGGAYSAKDAVMIYEDERYHLSSFHVAEDTTMAFSFSENSIDESGNITVKIKTAKVDMLSYLDGKITAPITITSTTLGNSTIRDVE